MSFDRFRAGDGCPLCAPRPDSNGHWELVAHLSASSLYLAKDQTYRGRCQLNFNGMHGQHRHAARPDQLSVEEWTAFSADLYRAEAAVMRVTEADHVNLESLGNMVPHLHWHIVPRYRDDPRWGSPIWLTRVEDMVAQRLPREEERALIRQLQTALGRE